MNRLAAYIIRSTFDEDMHEKRYLFVVASKIYEITQNYPKIELTAVQVIDLVVNRKRIMRLPSSH